MIADISKTNLTLIEFITLLNQNKSLIDSFWINHPKPIKRIEILARDDVQEEKLDILIAKRILTENENFITINEVISVFLEDFLQQSKDVNIGAGYDILKTIERNIEIYRDDNRQKFLVEIKRGLHKITIFIIQQIIKLQDFVEESYKNETNFETKRKKLEIYYKKDRNDIQNLIAEIDKLYVSNQGLFNLIRRDIEIDIIVRDLKKYLIEGKKYLFELQSNVIDYINQIKNQAEIYKKIQKLKEIKNNQGSLKHSTNIEKVAFNNHDIVFSNDKPKFRTKIPISFLYGIEGIWITEKIRNKLKKERGLSGKEHEIKKVELRENFDDIDNEQTQRLNIGSFLTKFKNNDSDLFDFILNFNFPENLNYTFEKCLTLYMEILMDFDKEIYISEKFEYHKFVTNENITKKIGYALIYPLK